MLSTIQSIIVDIHHILRDNYMYEKGMLV